MMALFLGLAGADAKPLVLGSLAIEAALEMIFAFADFFGVCVGFALVFAVVLGARATGAVFVPSIFFALTIETASQLLGALADGLVVIEGAVVVLAVVLDLGWRTGSDLAPPLLVALCVQDALRLL